jgi:hypothetical protein
MYFGYRVFDNGTIIGKRLGKPMKTIVNRYGYLMVMLMINGKRTNKRVHRLLAEAFLPNYYGLPTVDHKDINKLNNSLYNLKWESYRGQTINRGMMCNNTSGTKGVRFDKRSNTWEASIYKLCGKRTRKSFKTKEDAILQRLAWEREYY